MPSKSPRRAALVNDLHEPAEYRSTGPWGSFESLTATLSAADATSTQAPLLMLRRAFRQSRRRDSSSGRDISSLYCRNLIGKLTFWRDCVILVNYDVSRRLRGVARCYASQPLSLSGRPTPPGPTPCYAGAQTPDDTGLDLGGAPDRASPPSPRQTLHWPPVRRTPGYGNCCPSPGAPPRRMV